MDVERTLVQGGVSGKVTVDDVLFNVHPFVISARIVSLRRLLRSLVDSGWGIVTKPEAHKRSMTTSGSALSPWFGLLWIREATVFNAA